MEEKLFVKFFETKIDEFYKSLDLYKFRSRQMAQWYLLAVYQVQDQLKNLSTASDFSAKATGFKYAMYWVDELKDEEFFSPKFIDPVVFKEAEEFFKHAIEYQRVIAPFTLYWSGKARVEILGENKIRMYRTDDQYKFDILEFMLFQHPKKGLVAGKEARVPVEIADRGIKELLDIVKTVKLVGHGRFSYKANYKNIRPILIGFENMDVKFRLMGEEWYFSDFSSVELKAVFSCLRSLSFIHLACFLKAEALKKGTSVTAFLMTKSRQEWIDIISKSSEVSKVKVDKLLRIFTYDKEFKKRDIVFQPFVETAKNLLTIAPSLIGYVKLDVVFLSLMAKLHKKEYDACSGDFEKVMIDDVEKIFAADKFIFSKNRKIDDGQLPDVDSAIYDKETNTVLICECKFAIPPIGVREVLNRNEREAIGINQIKEIENFCEKNKELFLKKVFPQTKIEDPNFFYCVLFRGYYGSVNSVKNKVPVLEINYFEKILGGFTNFFDFCNFLKSFSFLPKEEEDFKRAEFELVFGNRVVIWEGAEVNLE